MKLNLGISAMLVTAVVAGAAGGAVALSAVTGPAPAPQAPVVLHQVAEEATDVPTSGPSQAPSPTAETEEPAVGSAPAGAELSDPAPIVDDVAKAETASQAADRAEAEADRAKAEADRAEEAAAAPVAPEPVAAEPVAAEPEPAPECQDGATKQDKLIRDGQLRTQFSYTCVDGTWKITGSQKYKLDGGSDGPAPVQTKAPAPATAKPEPTPDAEQVDPQPAS